ncbi:MAG TPA: class I SAM-dependent methyltransferase [Candidatus Binatia bacterium]|nr:class I SAM-dependent methyltransferase [Candidatus Binatia bacterium]
MSSGAGWSQGYVTDVSYTNSFFRELSPAWLNHVAVVSGAHPRRLNDGFTHIDLGCGLGQSSNVLAASFPKGQFVGVDFNPAHVDTAQHLAAQLGIENVRFIERAFEELHEVDLPDFDFVTLHGIYSWIGEGARQAVQRFIYKKLKPGGIVYNSYNCLPGWSGDAPIRRLLTEFAAMHHGDSAARVEKAAKDAEELANLKLGYFRTNASAANQVSNLLKRQTNYLAHEYLNASWNIFYSMDVAEEMAAAKLTYLGSATLMENHLDLMLPDPAAAYCRKQANERLRQLAQDFLIGQRFRRDVFVRGHPRLPRVETSRYLQSACFALPGSVEEFGEKSKVPRGEITFDTKSVAAVREVLSNGSAPLEEIIASVSGKKNVAEIERTVLMMTAVGKLIPVGAGYRPAAPQEQPEAVRIVDPTNRALALLGRQGVNRQYMVAPAVGSGLTLDSLDALALALLDEGTTVSKLTAAVSEELRKRGIRVNNKDGTPIADAKEAEARTTEIVGKFVSQTLPTLLRFGVVERA